MGDYHDLHITTDMLLLVGVFKNFRRMCRQNNGLDPANYYTAPGLSWDARMKHTGIKLKLLTCFPNAQRGSISSIGHQRYFKATNKYLPDYDPIKPSSFIMYLDANNLYGWAMSQPLQYAGFKWLSSTEIKQTQNHILCAHTDFEDRYMLQVDLNYPRELHDLHDYPLAPENMVVLHEWFSEYTCDLLDNYKDMSMPNMNKLMCTLHPKWNYVVHFAHVAKVSRSWLNNNQD